MNDSIKHVDVKVDSNNYEISLVKLTGLAIKDVRGYLSREFGDVTFKLTSIILENDMELGVEGEHDFPYLVTYPNQEPPNFDEKTLARLEDESNDG